MNAQSSSVRWYIKTIIFVFAVSMTQGAFAMGEFAEGVFEESEGVLAVAEGGAEAAAVESLGIEEFSLLDKSVQNAIKESFQEELESLATKYNNLSEIGELGSFDSLAEYTKATENAAGKSVDAIASLDSISELTASALQKFDFGTVELDMIDKVDVVSIAPEADPLYGSFNQAYSDFGSALDKLSDLSPLDEGYAEAVGEVTSAYENLVTEAETLGADADAALTTANDALEQATTDALDAVEASGSASEAETASEATSKAKTDADSATKTSKETTTKTAKQKYDAAAEDLKVKKNTYSEVKKMNDSLSYMSGLSDSALETYGAARGAEIATLEGEISTLEETITELTEKEAGEGLSSAESKQLTKAQEELESKLEEKTFKESLQKLADEGTEAVSSALEDSNKALKEAGDAVSSARAVRDAAVEEVTKASTWTNIKNLDAGSLKIQGTEFIKSSLKTSIGQVIGGAFFAVGAAFMTAVSTAWANKALKDALQSVQLFGGVYMRVPDALINGNDPTNSAPIYIGINVSDADLSDEDSIAEAGQQANNPTDIKAPAQVFVSYSSYSNWGTAAMGTTSFPDEMVHLNTGYLFIGNGDPLDLDSPILPYFSADSSTSSQAVVAQSSILSGIALGGSTGEATTAIFIEEETGIDGDENLSNILNWSENSNQEYSSDSYAYPLTLNAAINSIRGGLPFGSIRLAEIQPLSDIALSTLASEGAVDSSYIPIESLPYQSMGTYIYQTFDTDLVLSGALKGTGIPDLVLAIDASGNDISAFIPYFDSDSYTYVLGINPEVSKIYSVLDGASYDVNGITDVTYSVPDLSGTSVASQVAALQNYVGTKLKYGPFKKGSVYLETDPAWVDAELPVYKISNALNITSTIDGTAVTVDDYVMPIVMATDGPSAELLPATASYLLSLVTSQFYTDLYLPVTTMATYYVIQDSSGNLAVTTSSPSSTQTLITSGQAPFNSLFMDADINPNQISEEAQNAAGLSSSWLPVPNQWALTLFAPANEGDTLSNVITSVGQSALLDSINTAYTTWKGAYISAMDSSRAIANEVGPFTYFVLGSVPISVVATSLSDVIKGTYVYTSDYYPDEYLVFATQIDGSDMGQQFNLASPQRYAISLSSGNVYDGKPSVTTVSPGDKVGNVSTSTYYTTLLSSIQTNNSELYDTIVASQALYASSLATVGYFGNFKVYLPAVLAGAGQYIYADVSGISDPASLDAAGTLLDQVNDFFVFSDSKLTDTTSAIYGAPLTSSTQLVASVVTGAVYNRAAYLGRYTSDTIVALTYEGLTSYMTQDVLGYQSDLINMATAGATLDSTILSRIASLTTGVVNTILAEKAEFDALQEQQAALYPPLDAGYANLDAAEYLPDDILGARYIKFYSPTGKYYYVVDSDLVSEGGMKYIDFNAGDAGQDNQLVVFYDTDGTPLSRVSDPYLVATARQQNGVYVDSSGTQTLGVPIKHPGIPVDAMLELDSSALETVFTTAQSNYDSALQALIDSPNSTTAAALNAAASVLGNAKVAYESAVAVDGVTVPTGYTLTFYQEQNSGHYYVLVTVDEESYYIDLISGFEYYTDGTPRFKKNPVFQDEYGLNNELFYQFSVVSDIEATVGSSGTSQDSLNSSYSLLGLIYSNTLGTEYITYQQMGPSTSVRNEFLITDFYPGVTYSLEGSEQVVRYDMSSMEVQYDDEGDALLYNTLKVYQNDPTYAASNNEITKFATYELVEGELYGDVDTVFTGSFTPEDGVYSMIPVYYQTRTGTDTVMTDSTMFGEQPVVVVWDGSSDMSLQRIVYKGQMIELSGGPTTFTGGSITVTVNKDEVSLGRYLTITDGSANYDFLFASEVAGIADAKETYWGINAVVDSLGKSRLVNSITAALQTPSISGNFIDAASFSTAGTPQYQFSSIISSFLSDVSYDPVAMRYLYQLQSTDSSAPYYEGGLGWYIDLSNGILYDLFKFPRFALSYGDLLTLLDTLGMQVVYDESGSAKLAYRSSCNVILEQLASGETVDQATLDVCGVQ